MAKKDDNTLLWVGAGVLAFLWWKNNSVTTTQSATHSNLSVPANTASSMHTAPVSTSLTTIVDKIKDVFSPGNADLKTDDAPSIVSNDIPQAVYEQVYTGGGPADNAGLPEFTKFGPDYPNDMQISGIGDTKRKNYSEEY